MSSPPTAFENFINKQIKFDKTETFKISNDENSFNLTVCYNKDIIYFDITELNTFFSNKVFNIYLNIIELGKINKFFNQFDTLEEVYESIKYSITENNLNIIKAENEIKIKINNKANGKSFYINIPSKDNDKDLKNDIIPYIVSLNEKIEKLEQKIDILNNIVLEQKKQIQELNTFKNKYFENKENEINNFMFKNSSIIKPSEQKLILNWFNDKKPINFKLLLDTKTQGDSIKAFINNCSKKCPTMVFIKTTNGYRFGGYTSKIWGIDKKIVDKNSFLFSLDLKEKYEGIDEYVGNQIYIKYKAFSFGLDSLFIYDGCTTGNKNGLSNNSYYLPGNYRINGGEKYFTVSNYEVYQIEY